jgi:hypothetical protein
MLLFRTENAAYQHSAMRVSHVAWIEERLTLPDARHLAKYCVPAKRANKYQ